ncbi:hypothetical protein Z043_118626 [Scleropages formosus]|uniref:Uncharacterized protein n=1 Tax=Scleropages formosus TaxID=113540 RepID=A0A0P7TZ95_SCLFO|nr:hypothetical protein Z043_118626 [Scleropages formosus]
MSLQSRKDRSRAGDRDRQLLQDLVSLYLSSSPPSTRHRVAPAIRTSQFYDELNFPLDYAEDYITQEEVFRQRQHKKTPADYSTLSELDDATLQRVAGLLEKSGIDLRDLTLEQLNTLSAALKLLQSKSSGTQASQEGEHAQPRTAFPAQ